MTIEVIGISILSEGFKNFFHNERVVGEVIDKKQNVGRN